MGSSKGKSVEVDRTTPLPPPLRENLGNEKRHVLEIEIRDWLYKVAGKFKLINHTR